MKRIFFLITLLLCVFATALVHSARRNNYQLVDVMVCEEGVLMAEVLAMATVSRRELYSVSYCTCYSVDPSMKAAVTRTPCDPPKTGVYVCECIGINSY